MTAAYWPIVTAAYVLAGIGGATTLTTAISVGCSNVYNEKEYIELKNEYELMLQKKQDSEGCNEIKDKLIKEKKKFLEFLKKIK